MTIEEKSVDEVFDFIDLNKTGYIEKKEFYRGFKIIFKLEDNDCEDLIEDIFRIADGKAKFSMKDGKLNKREFLRIFKRCPKPIVDSRKSLITIIFNLIDKNKNGKISKNEFKKYIETVENKMKSKELNILINKVFESKTEITKQMFIDFIIEDDLNL